MRRFSIRKQRPFIGAAAVWGQSVGPGPGGWWQADPTENSVMVFLAHNMLELKQLSRGVDLRAYDAISQFHAWGSGT